MGQNHFSSTLGSPQSAGSVDLGELSPADLAHWRKDQRERLIAERLSLSPEVRSFYARQIIEKLNKSLPDITDLTISGYWPCKGEPDLRSWLRSLHRRHAHAALPVVRAKDAALRFRCWHEGDPMERGVWNILHPANGAEVAPDIIIAPLVGFDPAGYRLGYGGGYFDRTLVAARNDPLIVGVGFGQARLPTIHPQPHDIPMDLIITEEQTVTFVRPKPSTGSDVSSESS